jgi:2-C-methyl-D-erythritol 2,4-cyclodiphosphate synthase
MSGPGDGDLICRGVLDALLSAAGMPDLRTVFPDDEEELKGVETLVMLSQAVNALMRQRLAAVLNVNVRLLCPPELKLGEERKRMESALAAALEVLPGQVSVSFGATAELAVAERQSVVAFAHCLCLLQTPAPPGARRAPSPARQGEIFTEHRGAGPDALANQADCPRAQRFEQALRASCRRCRRAGAAGGRAADHLRRRRQPRQSGAGRRRLVVLDARPPGRRGLPRARRADQQRRRVPRGGRRAALGRAAPRLRFHERLDSELVVRQLRGEWKIKEPALRRLAPA